MELCKDLEILGRIPFEIVEYIFSIEKRPKLIEAKLFTITLKLGESLTETAE